MIGKLAKFAAGNESVHSTTSTQDFAFLAELARARGADNLLTAEITRSNTAQEVSDLIQRTGLPGFFDAICQRAWEFGRTLSGGALTVDIYLTGQNGEVLGCCRTANQANGSVVGTQSRG
jgi:cobalt-precorrin-5B (C1)-methyltransferase